MVRVGDFHDRCLARDLLDGAHEDIGDDRDAEETPDESDEVDGRPGLHRPCVLTDERQDQPDMGTLVLGQVAVALSHFGWFRGWWHRLALAGWAWAWGVPLHEWSSNG